MTPNFDHWWAALKYEWINQGFECPLDDDDRFEWLVYYEEDMTPAEAIVADLENQ